VKSSKSLKKKMKTAKTFCILTSETGDSIRRRMIMMKRRRIWQLGKNYTFWNIQLTAATSEKVQGMTMGTTNCRIKRRTLITSRDSTKCIGRNKNSRCGE
jgi:hypothetical protein